MVNALTDSDQILVRRYVGQVATELYVRAVDLKVFTDEGLAADSFKTIAVAGQDSIVADNATDTLTIVAGTNITITTNSTTDAITINSSGGGGISDGDKGDITVSSSGSVWEIDSGVVSNAKMANMTTKTYKGRTSGTTGAPEDISLATLKTDLGLPQTTVTGNAGTATALQTARNIQGVAFDGTAPIDIISGTGFVKSTGTSLSYDNSTYLTTGAAAAAYQPLDGDLTTIAGLTATTDNFIVSASSAWASRTPTQVKATLGATTVGNNIFTLTNPSAITFIRVNADNSVTARSAANFLSDIGAQPAGTYLTSANIVATITNGVTTNAPSEDAVFDALALKANLASPTFTGTVTLPASQVLVTPVLGTPTSGVLTNCTGTAAGLTAGSVTTNANLTGDVTSSGNATTIKTSVSLTTPIIGVATGTSLAVTGALTSSGGGVGYATGAGGTTSQGTSRVTTVVLNKLCGTFTMFSSAVVAAASSTFTFTNSFIAAGDIVLITHNSTTNACCWICEAIAGAGSATVVVKNVSAASITEATPLKFIVIKAVTA